MESINNNVMSKLTGTWEWIVQLLNNMLKMNYMVVVMVTWFLNLDIKKY